MKWCLICLTVILFICCSEHKGEEGGVVYDSVEITFDGYGEYDVVGELKILITKPEEIRALNRLKNESQRKWLGNVKGTEYVIKMLYVNTATNERLLLRILKSENSSPTIEYGSGTLFDGMYNNNELVDYVASLIKLETIKEHQGSLSQEEYNAFN